MELGAILECTPSPKGTITDSVSDALSATSAYPSHTIISESYVGPY